MKLLKISIILIFLFNACSLSSWDTRLILVNQTSDTVNYYYELKDEKEFIPDTAYCNNGDLYNIPAHGEKRLRTLDKWEFSLRDRPEKVLRVYIINRDTLRKYGTCKVFLKQAFLKRFDLRYQDFVDLNWRVVYKNEN